MSDKILYGILAHLIADWLFQNDWMARNKADLRHPAAWAHGGIHALLSCLVFGWPGLLVGVAHILIDTRRPIQWWQRVYRQTAEGPYAIHVALWSDQVLHVVVIVIAAGVTG